MILYKKILDIDKDLLHLQKDIKLKQCKIASQHNKMDNNERLTYCNEALNLYNNDHGELYYLRGKIYKDLKQWDKASNDFEQAIQRDRQNQQYNEELRSVRFEEKKAKRKDYYKILGIDNNANAKDIKKAFRKCGIEHHPDQHASKSEEERSHHEELFKSCVEANDILSDPETKSRYDRGEDVLEQQQGGNRGGHPGGFPFGQGFFHQQGGFPFGNGGGGGGGFQQQQGGGQRFTFRFG
jgi:DnaJ family protein C protein 7